MEPFSIRCETCAARLKVTNPSAVGQKLACPKCGSMILVAAPDGWDLDDTKNSDPPDAKSDSKPAADSSGEFDDIEQILRQKERPPIQQPREIKPKTAKPKTRPSTTVHSASSDSSPLLPNENWTATGTKKRQRGVLIGAGILGLLVVSAAIMVAVNVGAKKQPLAHNAESGGDRNAESGGAQEGESNQIEIGELQTEAEIDGQPKQSSTLEMVDSGSKNSGLDSDLKNAEKPTSDQAADSKSNEQETDNETDSANSTRGPTSTEISESPDAKAKSDPPAVAQVPKNDVEQNRNEQGQNKAKTDRSEGHLSLDDLLDQPTTKIEDVKTNFDALTEALESGGSSLFDINQLALLNSDQRRVGLAKYFIKKPEPLNPGNLQRLNDPFKGLQFADHSFLQFLADIVQVTGTPVSFDSENLIHTNLEYGFRLQDFKQTDSNFKSALQAGLGVSGLPLVLEYDGNSFALITIAGRDEIQTTEVTLPKLSKISADNFLTLLKQMIAPGTWNADQDKTIVLDGSAIKIRHHPATVSKVVRFIERWETALKVKQGELTLSVLDNRWNQSINLRQLELDIDLSEDTYVLDFAALVKSICGINLIFDLPSLESNGWNYKTAIPIGFSEPKVDDVIAEIAHSMNVSCRAVSPNTFEFLSNEKMSELAEVEFYNCSGILSGPLNQEQLIEILRQSLQSAGRLDGTTRAYFESDIDCFIVVGPQDVQRLFQSVLKRLEEVTKQSD